MSQQIAINSSTFQPIIDFTNWCKIETSHLTTPLTPNNKWPEIAKKIIIICSIIIPVIGALSIMLSNCTRAVPRPVFAPQQRPTGNAPAAPATREQQVGPEIAPEAAQVIPLQVPQNRPVGNGSPPAERRAQAPMGLGDFQIAEGQLMSLEETAVGGGASEQLDRYVQLRETIQKIDPAQLKKECKTIYDHMVARIRQLDTAANFSLSAQGKREMAAFAPN